MRQPRQRAVVSKLTTIEDRYAAGRGLRERTPRSAHAAWQGPANRLDPLALLHDADAHRLRELVPIRYGRMRQSPFTFFRGSAAVMAADLARTPVSGIRVQAGGDCHIMNFGAFATPERNIIFDINDFDETLPAPWEWDVKRLCASVEVAARAADFKRDYREEAVRSAVRSYRDHISKLSAIAPLEAWYEHIDLAAMVKRIPRSDERVAARREIAKARRQSIPSHLFPSLAHQVRGGARINDDPPLIYHPPARDRSAYRERVAHAFKGYRESLAPPYRVLLDRYELQDIAIKVVGVGSVGTFCAIALFTTADQEPLFLQVKEATASVLERHASASLFPNHGERVVMGQRLMQAASDLLLGWTAGLEPRRHFYIRQLRDIKVAMPLATAGHDDSKFFAEKCAQALARAHARSGDPAMIAGYLGAGEAFDDAIVKFAAAYADQTEQDHAALVKAIKAGRIKAVNA
jgi:uncharacterized protein (DUF2252 family)